jgi:hypothetical protein
VHARHARTGAGHTRTVMSPPFCPRLCPSGVAFGFEDVRRDPTTAFVAFEHCDATISRCFGGSSCSPCQASKQPDASHSAPDLNCASGQKAPAYARSLALGVSQFKSAESADEPRALRMAPFVMTCAVFLIATSASACDGRASMPLILTTVIGCFVLAIPTALILIRPFLDWRTAKLWEVNRARDRARYDAQAAAWAREQAEKAAVPESQTDHVPDALREAKEATHELLARAQKLMEEL